MRGKLKLYLKRSSPTILCCIAAVGVVGSVITAVKATPKAMRLLEDIRDENGDLNKAEAVVAVAPVYLPTAAIAFGTICCIFGANALNKRQQAQLMSAYALLSNYHKKYRGKLIELYGKEADDNIRNAMAREHCNYHQIDPDFPDEKVIFYDEISGESVQRYERDIIDAEYHFNRNFVLRGCALLNDLYEFLGMPKTDYGETVGWSMSSGISWVDFEHRLIDADSGGPVCYSIDMTFPPMPLDEWDY